MKSKAEALARKSHAGHFYNGEPYVDAHLIKVVAILESFGFIEDHWIAAGFLHDTIEDCNVTREDIYEEFGILVGDLVWAVTGIGATRKIRNADIAAKIMAYPEAAILKVADRIANVEASAGTRFMEMYRNELDEFASYTKPYVPTEMWERLERAFK